MFKKKIIPWEQFRCGTCPLWDRIQDPPGVAIANPVPMGQCRLTAPIVFNGLDLDGKAATLTGQVRPNANERCFEGWKAQKLVR